MTIVYLVRHGQTYLNRYYKMQGWSDSPLTEKGVADAKRVGQIFKNTHFMATFSSDANRAQNTAKIIIEQNQASSPQPIANPDFRECFYGYFEGMNSNEAWVQVSQQVGLHSFSELIEHYSLDTAKDLMHQADPFHDAETAQQYWKRLDRGFEFLKSQIKEDSNDPILLVTHGTTIRSIAGHYRSEKKFNLTDSPLNGSITTLEINKNLEIIIKDYNKLNI